MRIHRAIFAAGQGERLVRRGAPSQDCFAEDDSFVVEPLAARRHAVENLVRAAATRDVRTIVIRPGLIWGPGDHGHLSMIYQSVAATGAAGPVGSTTRSRGGAQLVAGPGRRRGSRLPRPRSHP